MSNSNPPTPVVLSSNAVAITSTLTSYLGQDTNNLTSNEQYSIVTTNFSPAPPTVQYDTSSVNSMMKPAASLFGPLSTTVSNTTTAGNTSGNLEGSLTTTYGTGLTGTPNSNNYVGTYSSKAPWAVYWQGR